jgi:anti-sigma regulatory factor (Ser/Thr protein kinase)
MTLVAASAEAMSHTASAITARAAPPMPGQAARWVLARDAAQVRHARHQVRRALAGWGLSGHADLVELVVSELVTNALRHGDGPIEVCLVRAGGELRVSAHDDGDGRPVLRHPRADDETGRGLALISAMIEPCAGVITTTSGGDERVGKTVHVTVMLAASPGDGT